MVEANLTTLPLSTPQFAERPAPQVAATTALADTLADTANPPGSAAHADEVAQAVTQNAGAAHGPSAWLAWAGWLGARLLSGVVVVIAISIIVFLATQALPSDPARTVLGPDAPESAAIILRHQLGLDLPLPQQYLHWAGKALQGDWGRSFDSHVPVTGLVAARLGNSLVLLSCVMLVSLPLALVIGVGLALRRDSRLDRWLVTGLITLKAIPAFAVAIGLIMLLATSVFSILPAVSLLDPARSPFLQLQFLVLPTLTLVASTVPYLARLVRASMIETLESDYVTAARLRGIPAQRIIWRHALPNALIPAINGVALSTSVLFGGSLVIEVIFTYPGLGTALNAAVDMRDIPVIQASVLLIATGVVAINVLADLVTVVLTPKLRTMQTASWPRQRLTRQRVPSVRRVYG